MKMKIVIFSIVSYMHLIGMQEKTYITYDENEVWKDIALEYDHTARNQAALGLVALDEDEGEL